MPKEEQKPIVDDPNVCEAYSNQIISSSFDGGAIIVTFGVERFVPARLSADPKPIDKPAIRVVCRLALSPPAASALVNGIAGLLQAIQPAKPSPFN